MDSSGPASSLSRKRILANAQDRSTGDTPQSPEEDAAAAARNEAAERILSKPVKGKAKKTRRKKRRSRSTTQVVLLAVIGISGIAAIIGLRYLSEAFGVNWIGE